MANSINKDSSILDILKSGGAITFPSGYMLRADRVCGYIDLVIINDEFPQGTRDGLCELSEKGLTEAFGWADKYEADRLNDEKEASDNFRP